MANVVKKIFSDGYKLNPIDEVLMLENSLFLFSLNQHELSLKNLLMIEHTQLSLQDYYVYWVLKKTLS